MEKFASRLPALHIPDGFLSLPIALFFWGVTVILIWIAVRKTRQQFADRQIPLMGVMAAFIFAAQMINFPVAGGTSGHLLGGVLAAVTLGPWAGMLVMAAVVGVQGLLFQDGGLLVMGANIFNMGFLTVLIGYGLYQLGARGGKRSRLAVVAGASWLSVIAAALMTSLQLWLSGTSALRVVVPAMLGVHALIGIGEALITMAAVTYIWRLRPEMRDQSSQEKAGRGWVVAGVLTSLAVILIAPFASGNPDGLERVAMDLGFFGERKLPGITIIPNYRLPFLGEGTLSNILAGVLGALLVAAVVLGIVRLIRRRPSR